MDNKSTVKKVLGIIGYVIFGLFLLMAVVIMIISISAKKSNEGAASFFGYQLRTVLTASMEENEKTDVSGFDIKSIKRQALVIVDCVPTPPREKNTAQVVESDAVARYEAKAHEWYSKLKVGDVLTFKYDLTKLGEMYKDVPKNTPITHRITKIEELPNGGFYIELKGDNDPNAQPQHIDDTSNWRGNTEYVIGKVVGTSYPIGVVITSLQTKLGIVLAIIVPSVLIIIYESIKITRILGKDKRERLIKEKKDKEDEMKDKEDEITRLRRELEEMKKNTSNTEKNEEEN